MEINCIGYDAFIQEIADELSFNYMTVSFGETHKDGHVVAGIDDEKEIFRNVFSKEFRGRLKIRKRQKCRNILIIGSGATNDAYAAMPIGFDTKKVLAEKLHLNNLLNTNEAFKSKFIEEAIRILTIKKGTPPVRNQNIFDDPDFDFESFLLLLTKFFREQEIREAIFNLFNLRYAPALCYEIIAHLFKHGFIDIIINFNFDELLDQAIKEEMGKGNYHKIISDGDCKDISEIVVDGRLKIPLYIKPHGTISHKSSLRFTKDHYIDLPDDIKKLLEQILRGQLNKDHKAPTLKRVNVISIGFNLESVDLNEIIQSVDSNIKMYSVFYNDRRLPKMLTSNETNGLFKNRGDKFRVLTIESAKNQWDQDYLSKNKLTPLAKIFLDIYERISKNFQPLYTPRGLTRHLLFSEIFYDLNFAKGKSNYSIEDLDKLFNDAQYFKERSIIELAISLVRGRGKIELKELMNDRLGEVYKRYRQSHEKQHRYSLPSSLYDLAEIFMLKEEFSFSRNIHNIQKVTIKEIENNEDIATIFEWDTSICKSMDIGNNVDFGRLVVFRILSSLKSPESLKLKFKNIETGDWDEIKIKKTVDYFVALHNYAYYHDINPVFYAPKLYIFDHFYKDQILHTNLSFSYRFNEVFLNTDTWDILLHVSDTGLRLTELLNYVNIDWKKSNKKIYVMTCLEAIKQNYGIFEPMADINKSHIEKFKKSNASFGEALLHGIIPYSDHNHHVSIFLKKIDPDEIFLLSKYPTFQIKTEDGCVENYIFVRSTYFYKRGFSNKINPLWVRGAYAFLKDETIEPPNNFGTNLLVKDHMMLLETFYAYHKKALSFLNTDGRYIEYLLPKDMTGDKMPTERVFNLRELFVFLNENPDKDPV